MIFNMKREISIRRLTQHFKEGARPFLRENKKLIIQSFLTLFFFTIGIWFIKHESAELADVRNALVASRWQWVVAGIGLTALYILLQGQMYVYSFASVKNKVSLTDAVILFIKRNFISIFLPAGGISSLAFYTQAIERKGITKSQIHFSSTIYGFIGILTVVVVAVPAFIYSVVKRTLGSDDWLGLGAVVLIIVAFG